MNNVELWLLPVIMVVVWIVSSFARSTDNDKSGNRSRRSRADRSGGERGQRSATDIDRFLEEVNRRRREATERKPGPAETPKRATPSAARPAPAVAARPKPAGSRLSTPARTTSERPVPTAQPAKAPPAVPIAQRIAAAEAVALLEALPVTSPPAAPVAESFPTTGDRSAPNSAATAAGSAMFLDQLLTIFQGPQNLAMAVVLQEVFGPPRCRQPRIR